MSESEWVLIRIDTQHRVTIPPAVRDFYGIDDPGYVLAKFKRPEKVE